MDLNNPQQLITPSFFETPLLVDSLDENDSPQDDKYLYPETGTKKKKKIVHPQDYQSIASSSKTFVKRSPSKDWKRRTKGGRSKETMMRSQDQEEDDDIVLQQLKCQNTKFQLQNPCFRMENVNEMMAQQQMKFIDRLQQDISQLNNELNERDDTIDYLKKTVHRKDSELKRRDLEHDVMVAEKRRHKEELDDVRRKIVQLKSQLAQVQQEKSENLKRNEEFAEQLRCEHEIEVSELQKTLEEVRAENMKNRNDEQEDFQHQLQTLNQSWQEKISHLLEDKNKMMQEFHYELKKEEQIIEEKEKAVKIESEKRRSNEEKLKNLQAETAEKDGIIKVLEKKNEEAADEYGKLKIYIQQTKSEHLQVEQWKNDQKKQQQFIKDLENEKLDLIKTLQVVQIRLDSISKIVQMQEGAIANHVKAIPQEYSQNKPAVVMSLWREKVFQLMVQLKSQDIVIRDMTSRHKMETSQLTKNLTDARREEEITRSRLEDSQAQNQLKEHHLIKFEEKKLESENEIKSLKTQIQQLKHGMKEIYTKIQEFGRDGKMENIYNICVESCLRNEQRISFANNRLKTIRDLLKRKEARHRMKLHDHNPMTSSSHEEHNQREMADLKLQNEQLTNEQDLLRAKMLEDSAEFEKIVTELKENESKLQREQEINEQEKNSLERKIEELGVRLENAEEKWKSSNEERMFAMHQLKNIHRSHDKELDEARCKVETELQEQIHEEKMKGEKLEREMAKTVLALRQTERSAIREKTRLSEQAETDRELWKSEEKKFLDEICCLKKDNTMLMASLRQEGLIPSKSKTQQQSDKLVRFHPSVSLQRVDLNEPTKETSTTFIVQKPISQLSHIGDGDKADQDDIEEMLKNLNDLSEKVLESD